MSKLTFIDLFAGIGGFRFGMEKAGHKCVGSIEYDKYANASYNAMHNPSEDEYHADDLWDVKASDLPQADCYCAGFPCQSFSITGKRKGFDDRRGMLFFKMMELVKANKPRYLVFENVKHILKHNDDNTIQQITDAIVNAGYSLAVSVLNTSTHANIPQNRERVFFVGFLHQKDFKNFEFPKAIPLTKKITDIIDLTDKKPDKYYYGKDNMHYKILSAGITKQDTLYQYRRSYVRENKSKLCPTLTANIGTGGNNVPLVLDNYGIRKLTPVECLQFQGYPKSMVQKAMQVNSNMQLYKQSGNSVTVPIIYRIALNLRNGRIS